MIRKYILPIVIILFFLSGCRRQGLAVQDIWARPGNVGGTSAVYFIVENPASSDEMLLSATSEIAEAVEMHMSKMEDSDVMSMQHQLSVTIPANGKVEFQPGGFHLMLVNLKKDLKPGEKFLVTLNYQNQGAVNIEAEVREP